MSLSDEDVREILRIIDESALTELQIDTEGFSLHVRKGGGDAPAPIARPRKPRRPTTSRHLPSQRQPTALPRSPPRCSERSTAPRPPASRRSSRSGARVEPDTIVCIIEVMKMMNSVTAGVSGLIAEVVPANAELVEYGQPLFRVEPA